MNTSKITILSAGTAVAVLVAIQIVRADDLLSEAAAAAKITKGPVMASPHGLEEFPALTHPMVTTLSAGQLFVVPKSIKSNEALSNNPRVREAWPALTRVEQAQNTNEGIELKRALDNKALANSPRTEEEFPELQREKWPQAPSKVSSLPTNVPVVSRN